MPKRPEPGLRSSPRKSASMPAAILRIVVLPQPEGPISAPNDPASSRSFKPLITSTGMPSADRKTFASMRSSSGAASPADCASFKRLYQKAFDHEHEGDERDRIAQYPGHVEQREGRAQHEAHAVGASDQLDHEHDFPDDREAGTRTGGQVWRQLRDDDMTDPRKPAELKGASHLVELGVERAGALAHHHDYVRQLVEGDRQDRRSFVEADPDIGENDRHQRRQIDQHDQPGIGVAVDGL